jgi:hypothetical protein
MLIIAFLLPFLCIATDQKPTNYFSQCLRHMQTVQALEKAMPSSSYSKVMDQCTLFMINAFDDFNKRHSFSNELILTNFCSYKANAQKILQNDWQILPLPEKKFFTELIHKKLQRHRLSPLTDNDHILYKKFRNSSRDSWKIFILNYEILDSFYMMAQSSSEIETPNVLMVAKSYLQRNTVKIIAASTALDLALMTIVCLEHYHREEEIDFTNNI